MISLLVFVQISVFAEKFIQKKTKILRFRFIYAMQPHWNVVLLCECDCEHLMWNWNPRWNPNEFKIWNWNLNQSVHTPMIFANNLGLSIEFKERFISFANYVPGICTAARTPIYGQFFHQSRKCVQQHQRENYFILWIRAYVFCTHQPSTKVKHLNKHCFGRI